MSAGGDAPSEPRDHRLSDQTVAQRRPIWEALSCLWLDQPVDDSMLDTTARTLAGSAYSWPDIEAIYQDEVLPVVHRNLSVSGAWVWSGFDPDWLAQRCSQQLNRDRSASRLSRWWLWRKHRRLLGQHWESLAHRVEQMRSGSVSSDRW